MAIPSTTGCCIALLLLSFLLASSCFNINTAQNCGRNRRRMPPLFYTDIEPEIRSITIPPVIYFNNGTSITVQTTDDAHNDVSDSITKKPKKSARRNTSKRTKKKPAATSKSSSSQKEKKTHDSVWHRHYADLQQYQKEHGNCLVPQNYAENRKLGLWVMQQRRQYTLMLQGKTSSLSGKRGEYRLQLLEDIGFVWRLDRRGPRGSYGALRRTNALAEHETHIVANFEEYMIEKSTEYTDKQKRDAWLKRFEVLR